MGFGIFGNKRRVKPIFVGSYGNDITRGIYAFHIDIDNGELLKKKFYKSLANPVSLYRRERFIYTCYKNNSGNATDGGLWQYAQMELQFGLAARASYKGKTYMGTYVNPDRTYAYAVDYYNGEVVVVPILKQKIVKMTQVIKIEGSSVDPKRQTKSHPHFIEATPDEQRIFVCDLGTDEVVFYKVVDKGQLERDDVLTVKLEPGSGPKKMIFSPCGKFAYVLNELSNTVTVFKYSLDGMEFIATYDTFPKDQFDKPSLAGDIVMTTTGQYVMVSNRGHDSLTIYRRNDVTGELEFIEFVDTDQNPRSLLIIDDRWVIVASQKGGTLETFEIKEGESKGVLFETHFSYMVGEPVCMVEGRLL